MTINSDINASLTVPGIFGQIDLRSGSNSLGATPKSALILGYKNGGTAEYNVPVEVTGDADIDRLVGRDSWIAEEARALLDGPNVKGVVKLTLVPLQAPSSGVAQILTMAVVSAPSTVTPGTPGANTAATSSGSWTLWVDEMPHVIAIVNGDTLATVMATIVTALTNNVRLRWTPASTGGGGGTLTNKTKGLHSDGVLRIDYGSVDVGLRLSPGTVTFAGTTTATGTHTLTVGAAVISTDIANPSTPTQSGAAVVEETNAGGYVVTAAASAGAVTYYLAQGRDYRFATSALTGATAQTATAAFGTAGSGSPDFTAALAILAGQPSLLMWSMRFIDATSIGTVAAHINTYNNGRYQKNQYLLVCSPFSGSAWGAVLAATSPNITTVPYYYTTAWNQPDCPGPAGKMSARLAGILASLDYVALNMDRYAIRSRSNTLLIPAVGSRPDLDTRNSDMLNLGVSPIVVFADNLNHIDSARTTIIRSTASDTRVCELGVIRTALAQRDAINADLDAYLFSDDGGKNFRSDGLIHTPYVATIDSIKQCILNTLRKLDVRDLVQNTEDNKDLIQGEQEPGQPTTLNYFIPFDPVLPIHILNYKQSLV